MNFRPLPPGAAQELIEGYEDTLTPRVESRRLRTSASVCPRCRCTLQERLHPHFLFDAGDPLPRIVAHCVDCGYVADPKTGLVLDTGSWAKVEDKT